MPDRHGDFAEAPANRERVPVDDVAEREQAVCPIREDGPQPDEHSGNGPGEEGLEASFGAAPEFDGEDRGDECPYGERAPDDDAECAGRSKFDRA